MAKVPPRHGASLLAQRLRSRPATSVHQSGWFSDQRRHGQRRQGAACSARDGVRQVSAGTCGQHRHSWSVGRSRVNRRLLLSQRRQGRQRGRSLRLLGCSQLPNFNPRSSVKPAAGVQLRGQRGANLHQCRCRHAVCVRCQQQLGTRYQRELGQSRVVSDHRFGRRRQVRQPQRPAHRSRPAVSHGRRLRHLRQFGRR